MLFQIFQSAETPPEIHTGSDCNDAQLGMQLGRPSSSDSEDKRHSNSRRRTTRLPESPNPWRTSPEQEEAHLRVRARHLKVYVKLVVLYLPLSVYLNKDCVPPIRLRRNPFRD